jgi:GT2 family glycosyltransferase
MNEKITKASVVIPTYNKIERLRVVLGSFNFQTADPDDFEIVLVDDGSRDLTESELKKIPMRCRLTYIYQENAGRSAARNRGIKAARFPLLVFCDDDTIPNTDFIQEHLAAHRGTIDGVVHGRIYNLPYLKYFRDPCKGTFCNADSNRQIDHLRTKCITETGVKLFTQIAEQKKIPPLERLIIDVFKRDISHLKWLSFTGGNISVEKTVLERYGVFDERFGRTWGGEDLELGYRLFLAGCSFLYCQKASCFHIAHVRSNYLDELKKTMELFHSLHPVKEIRYLEELLSGRVRDVTAFSTMLENV